MGAGDTFLRIQNLFLQRWTTLEIYSKVYLFRVKYSYSYNWNTNDAMFGFAYEVNGKLSYNKFKKLCENSKKKNYVK